MAARRNTEMNCKSCSIPGRSRFDGAFDVVGMIENSPNTEKFPCPPGFCSLPLSLSLPNSQQYCCLMIGIPAAGCLPTYGRVPQESPYHLHKTF